MILLRRSDKPLAALHAPAGKEVREPGRSAASMDWNTLVRIRRSTISGTWNYHRIRVAVFLSIFRHAHAWYAVQHEHKAIHWSGTGKHDKFIDKRVI